MTQVPRAVVLLAAGRGSRMAELTEHTHKSLLPVGGQPSLRYVIDEVIARGVEEIVLVTGDKRASIERFVHELYGPGRITLAHNARFAEDTNILSTELGVAALVRPERGYMIIETDIVMESAGWATVLDVGDVRESYWVTRGHYSQSLTGGALHADASGRVTDLVYSPKYTPAHEGWQKLLGVLYVGERQVAQDGEIRRRAIERSIAQYYMMTWVENLSSLPCFARPLGDAYAASFNDLATYRRVDRDFAELLERTKRTA